MEKNIEYLQKKYIECMMKILQDDKTPIVEREFYLESPNWYGNRDFKNVIDTLVWLTYTDKEKQKILDIELDEYFKV